MSVINSNTLIRNAATSATHYYLKIVAKSQHLQMLRLRKLRFVHVCVIVVSFWSLLMSICDVRNCK